MAEANHRGGRLYVGRTPPEEIVGETEEQGPVTVATIQTLPNGPKTGSGGGLKRGPNGVVYAVGSRSGVLTPPQKGGPSESLAKQINNNDRRQMFVCLPGIPNERSRGKVTVIVYWSRVAAASVWVMGYEAGEGGSGLINVTLGLTTSST